MRPVKLMPSKTFSIAVKPASRWWVWKMYPTCRPRKTSRRASESCVTSTGSPSPSNVIFPESGVRMPAIRCRSVVFPLPDEPTSATCSASNSANSGTSITGTAEPSGATYRLRKFWMRTAIRAAPPSDVRSTGLMRGVRGSCRRTGLTAPARSIRFPAPSASSRAGRTPPGVGDRGRPWRGRRRAVPGPRPTRSRYRGSAVRGP